MPTTNDSEIPVNGSQMNESQVPVPTGPLNSPAKKHPLNSPAKKHPSPTQSPLSTPDNSPLSPTLSFPMLTQPTQITQPTQVTQPTHTAPESPPQASAIDSQVTVVSPSRVPSTPPSSAAAMCDPSYNNGAPPTYCDDIQPVDRDFALDYEACMVALSDVHRLSRFLSRGARGPEVPQDPMRTTRRDVLEVLVALHDMLTRLFRRHSININTGR